MDSLGTPNTQSLQRMSVINCPRGVGLGDLTAIDRRMIRLHLDSLFDRSTFRLETIDKIRKIQEDGGIDIDGEQNERDEYERKEQTRKQAEKDADDAHDIALQVASNKSVTGTGAPARSEEMAEHAPTGTDVLTSNEVGSMDSETARSKLFALDGVEYAAMNGQMLRTLAHMISRAVGFTVEINISLLQQRIRRGDFPLDRKKDGEDPRVDAMIKYQRKILEQNKKQTADTAIQISVLIGVLVVIVLLFMPGR